MAAAQCEPPPTLTRQCAFVSTQEGSLRLAASVPLATAPAQTPHSEERSAILLDTERAEETPWWTRLLGVTPQCSAATLGAKPVHVKHTVCVQLAHPWGPQELGAVCKSIDLFYMAFHDFRPKIDQNVADLKRKLMALIGVTTAQCDLKSVVKPGDPKITIGVTTPADVDPTFPFPSTGKARRVGIIVGLESGDHGSESRHLDVRFKFVFHIDESTNEVVLQMWRPTLPGTTTARPATAGLKRRRRVQNELDRTVSCTSVASYGCDLASDAAMATLDQLVHSVLSMTLGVSIASEMRNACFRTSHESELCRSKKRTKRCLF